MSNSLILDSLVLLLKRDTETWTMNSTFFTNSTSNYERNLCSSWEFQYLFNSIWIKSFQWTGIITMFCHCQHKSLRYQCTAFVNNSIHIWLWNFTNYWPKKTNNPSKKFSYSTPNTSKTRIQKRNKFIVILINFFYSWIDFMLWSSLSNIVYIILKNSLRSLSIEILTSYKNNNFLCSCCRSLP